MSFLLSLVTNRLAKGDAVTSEDNRLNCDTADFVIEKSNKVICNIYFI